MEEETDKVERHTPSGLMIITVVVVFVVLVFAALTIPRLFGIDPFAPLVPEQSQPQEPQPAPPKEGEATDAGDEGQGASAPEPEQAGLPEHEHTWQEVYGLERVGVVTEEVEVAPVVGTETVNETICNVCQDVITDHVREHEQQTGHVGATPDVPITRRVVIEPAKKTEVVIDPGDEKLVVIGEKCSACGMTRVVEDEVSGQ